jgi:L-ascorbate metabolism protein UlaG (beta-lactamase superfamily)
MNIKSLIKAMRLILLSLLTVLFTNNGLIMAKRTYEKDIIATSAGNLEITFLGHGTLMLSLNGTIIHIDPYSNVADYTTLPKADLILVTHEHSDHLDTMAISLIKKENTKLMYTQKCAAKYPGGIVMKNGDTGMFKNISIEAIPAYNIVHKRDANQVYHPKGEGNGYILTVGDKRIYIAGDTENTPEMKALTNIDVAFLPMNVPYTMTPEMVADAAAAFKPKILYPYHYGDTNTQLLIDLMKNNKVTEVRIRNMK